MDHPVPHFFELPLLVEPGKPDHEDCFLLLRLVELLAVELDQAVLVLLRLEVG